MAQNSLTGVWETAVELPVLAQYICILSLGNLLDFSVNPYLHNLEHTQNMQSSVYEVLQEEMSEMEFIITGIRVTLTGLPKDI